MHEDIGTLLFRRGAVMSDAADYHETYANDPRTACHYGYECYQRNPAHRAKYKHPPARNQEKARGQNGKRKHVIPSPETDNRVLSADTGSNSDLSNSKKLRLLSPGSSSENKISASDAPATSRERSPVSEASGKDEPVMGTMLCQPSKKPCDVKLFIKEKFLVEMPDDFYDFYEFCKQISPTDCADALKVANLRLVGPFDVLTGKLKEVGDRSTGHYLRHWRYFYDPPEFQTVIKGDDKEGLHFGYWRDDPLEHPVFVAENRCEKDCKIVPVAANVFGAVDAHLEARIKVVGPFEKPKLASLRQRLRKFANERSLCLDKTTEAMRAREKRVVARTFHGAGIVVPYNKRTQLGYRELSETDANLKKIIKNINEAADNDERTGHLTQLEEVVRLATIAADECDFGTCLELGQDLFSSGSPHVEMCSLQMLTTAYTLLNRLEFLEIAKAHKDQRRKGVNLGVAYQNST